MILDSRHYWIFDMDGTLTHAVHDFSAIRKKLGLAEGAPILESISALDGAARSEALATVARWEHGLVRRAAAQPGVTMLLGRLQQRGDRLGILTRNLCTLAHDTLDATGLADFFSPEDVLGRDSAEPKPSPEGIKILLSRWGASPEEAVMVGDYVFDVQSGRAAGTATVLIDPARRPEWAQSADIIIGEFAELLGHVSN
jgi:HAD superfamily hydrolase (TIGR01509 family)